MTLLATTAAEMVEPDTNSNVTPNTRLWGQEASPEECNNFTLDQEQLERKNSNTIRSQSQVGTVPLASHVLSKRKKKCRLNAHKSSIPKEISFDSSSSPEDSELESQTFPILIKSDSARDEREIDFHNKCICLELLESERFDENCIGMEHLLSIANRELVNSSLFTVPESFDTIDTANKHNHESLLASSIGYSLVCNYDSNQNSGEFSERLTAVFPLFLAKIQQKKYYSSTEGEISDTDSTASLSSSFSSPSLYSNSVNSTGVSDKMIRSESGEISKTKLRLPALQILVSSLELVSRASSSRWMDLQNRFWRLVLPSMTACLQDLAILPTSGEKGIDSEKTGTSSSSIEAALVVKGFRLLYKLQPNVMSPYIRSSLLPIVSRVMEYNAEQQLERRQPCHRRGHHRRKSFSGDKMLVKESERLLRSFL